LIYRIFVAFAPAFGFAGKPVHRFAENALAPHPF